MFFVKYAQRRPTPRSGVTTTTDKKLWAAWRSPGPDRAAPLVSERDPRDYTARLFWR